MKKINTKAFDPIDKEEKELMKSIGQDEWKPVKNMKQEKKSHYGSPKHSENI